MVTRIVNLVIFVARQNKVFVFDANGFIISVKATSIGILMVRIAIAGATGRMGRELIHAISQQTSAELTVATVRSSSELVGLDAGLVAGVGALNLKLSTELITQADQFDVLIDYTSTESTLQHVEICRQAGKAILIGTTGFSHEEKAILEDASDEIPLLLAPNTSLGVNLVLNLLQTAAEALGETADIEIFEAHHRNKVDAPSGTAVRMGEVIAATLDRDLDEVAVYGREGKTGVRDRKEIGFVTMRAGDIVGDHNVTFAMDGERIEIGHKATNRQAFAGGGVKAALWLVKQPKGFYSMADMLGLKS